MKPNTFTINQSLEKLEKKELSCKELVESCLQRIEETDNDINSFIKVEADKALAEAEKQDEIRAKGGHGLLSGIPLSIKDLLCTKGTETTCGSKILENFVPPYDATVIEKIKKEGAIILGKVSMDEFAQGNVDGIEHQHILSFLSRSQHKGPA